MAKCKMKIPNKKHNKKVLKNSPFCKGHTYCLCMYSKGQLIYKCNGKNHKESESE